MLLRLSVSWRSRWQCLCPVFSLEHFPVVSRKDPVSPVLKEVLSYVYLIQTGPHLLTPFLMPTESLCRMKCLPLMGSGGPLRSLFSVTTYTLMWEESLVHRSSFQWLNSWHSWVAFRKTERDLWFYGLNCQSRGMIVF